MVGSYLPLCVSLLLLSTLEQRLNSSDGRIQRLAPFFQFPVSLISLLSGISFLGISAAPSMFLCPYPHSSGSTLSAMRGNLDLQNITWKPSFLIDAKLRQERRELFNEAPLNPNMVSL